MNKTFKSLVVCFLFAGCVWMGTLIADKQKLEEQLIRIHVVADSDSPQDQQLKLQVRDAVLESIQGDLRKISDIRTAHSYLEERLPSIQSIAVQTLRALGCEENVSVTLGKACFERKDGPVVSLPAGVYDALQIMIGSGQGENWWSVLFSEEIYSETDSENIVSVFSSPILPVLSEEPQIRFYCLDLLGKLENIFCKG